MQRAVGEDRAEGAEGEDGEGGEAGEVQGARQDLQSDEADDGDEDEVVEGGHRRRGAASEGVDRWTDQQRGDADAEDP